MKTAEKRLVGTWAREIDYNDDNSNLGRYRLRSLKLYDDGTFIEINSNRYKLTYKPVIDIYNYMYKGTWTASGGSIRLVAQNVFEGEDSNMKIWDPTPRFNSKKGVYKFNYQLSSDGKTLNMEDRIIGTDITTLYKKQFCKNNSYS